MQKSIDLGELSEHLETVLREVEQRGVPYVVAQPGRPPVALVRYEDFVRSQAWEDDAAADAGPPDPDADRARLAELDAVRAHNDRLIWSETDSTDILRWLREGAYDE